jgi:hypothetical protein
MEDLVLKSMDKAVRTAIVNKQCLTNGKANADATASTRTSGLCCCVVVERERERERESGRRWSRGG